MFYFLNWWWVYGCLLHFLKTSFICLKYFILSLKKVKWLILPLLVTIFLCNGRGRFSHRRVMKRSTQRSCAAKQKRMTHYSQQRARCYTMRKTPLWHRQTASPVCDRSLPPFKLCLFSSTGTNDIPVYFKLFPHIRSWYKCLYFSDVTCLLNVKGTRLLPGPCFPKIASRGNSSHEQCPATHSTFLKTLRLAIDQSYFYLLVLKDIIIIFTIIVFLNILKTLF